MSAVPSEAERFLLCPFFSLSVWELSNGGSRGVSAEGSIAFAGPSGALFFSQYASRRSILLGCSAIMLRKASASRIQFTAWVN